MLFYGRSLQVAQALLIVAPAFILFGYNQAGVGPLATLQSWVHSFPEIDTINTEGAAEAVNSTKKGAVIASFQLGALIGALSCSYIGEKLGRRHAIFIGAFLGVIGQILQTASYGLAQFVVGRVILGYGIGLTSVAVPVWQSECSSAKSRGKHVVVDGICICLGYTLCNWIDFGLSKVSGTAQWRGPLAITFFFSIVMLVFVFFLPESPRWLVLVNRSDEAAKALAAYKGLPGDDESIRGEIAGIEVALEVSAESVSWKEMISGKDDERGNLISVYISTIFQDNLDMSSDMAKILASCAMTWKFLSSFVAFWAIDRLGRRKVFMISGTGMCCCMLALAVTNSFGKENHAANIVSALFMFIFNTFYPIGFLGGNFLYVTEVAPARLRNAMSAVSTANHWLWNFVVVMVTPVALSTIGYRYYIVYTVLSACIPIMVFIFFPETKGRNLEAVNSVFRDAETIWDIVPMARRLPEGESVDAVMQSNKEKELEVEQQERV